VVLPLSTSRAAAVIVVVPFFVLRAGPCSFGSVLCLAIPHVFSPCRKGDSPCFFFRWPSFFSLYGRAPSPLFTSSPQLFPRLLSALLSSDFLFRGSGPTMVFVVCAGTP